MTGKSARAAAHDCGARLPRAKEVKERKKESSVICAKAKADANLYSTLKQNSRSLTQLACFQRASPIWLPSSRGMWFTFNGKIRTCSDNTNISGCQKDCVLCFDAKYLCRIHVHKTYTILRPVSGVCPLHVFRLCLGNPHTTCVCMSTFPKAGQPEGPMEKFFTYALYLHG